MVEWSGKWMAFTLDHKDAKAIERFREVHGRDPESVIRDENAKLLLLGPVKSLVEGNIQPVVYPHPNPLPGRERGEEKKEKRK